MGLIKKKSDLFCWQSWKKIQYGSYMSKRKIFHFCLQCERSLKAAFTLWASLCSAWSCYRACLHDWQERANGLHGAVTKRVRPAISKDSESANHARTWLGLLHTSVAVYFFKLVPNPIKVLFLYHTHITPHDPSPVCEV